MSRSTNWFSPTLRDSVKATVQAVESVTSAELVVAVRPSSGHYRHTDFALGGLLALATLCLFLYHPEPFDFTFLPLELGATFIAGVVLSVSVRPLRRALTSRRLMQENVERAARATFVELGVHKTRGRSGVLVLVSRFERRASVVADLGVPTTELASAWNDWCARVTAAARRRDTSELVESLRALGPLLAQRLPRGADDQNELSDELSENAA